MILHLRHFARAGIAALFALAGIAAPAQDQQAPPPAVIVAPAQMVDLQDSATFSGRLVATQRVDLQARVSGFLESVEFTEGDRVSAGDLLFKIEDDSYQASVAEIEGQIIAAEAERQLAELEQERTARLVARGTLAQADLDRADAALRQAEGSIARLEAQLSQAELNLSYTQILAPFDGIVGIRNFDVGALVSPTSGPLVTLTNLIPINVEFPITTATYLNLRERLDSGDIDPENAVTLTLPNGRKHDEEGTFNFVDAEVGRGTDTVLVRAEFPNANSRLLDGALVQVEVSEREGSQQLTVPAQSVQRDLAGPFVMLVDDANTVEQRRIDIGQTTQGLTIVISGLEEGDTVITEGVNKVRPGVTVDAAVAGDG